MIFLTTYVQNNTGTRRIHHVYHQSLVLKLLAIFSHNWHIFILLIFKFQTPQERSNQIAGFPIPDRS